MPRRERRIQIAAGAAICIAAYLFPYLFMSAWWRWMPSSIVILLTGAVLLGRSTLRFYGLAMSKRSALAVLAMFGILLVASSFVLLDVLNQPPLDVHATRSNPKYFGQLFQVFNDEVLVRAAAITILLRWFLYPKALCVVLAALFAWGHSLLYALHGSDVGWLAMVTLFSFGASANLLFVHCGHVGYSLAAHYAWNFYRFNSTFWVKGHRLSQGETFNHIEGNPWIASTALVVFAVLLLLVSSSKECDT